MTNLIVVTGPTASGKTAFAAQLAERIGGEIISADSRQVYKKMNIGTGKDYQDYTVNGKQVPVHLIDIHDPGYKYNVSEFVEDFWRVYKEIHSRGLMPILCGGTGMYIEAVLNDYELKAVPVDEDLRESLEDKSLNELLSLLDKLGAPSYYTDRKHRKRTLRAIEVATYLKAHPEIEETTTEKPQLSALVIGMEIEREVRRKKISKRLEQRFQEGMVNEVEELLTTVDAEDLIFYGLEYKFITLYLQGEMSYEEMKKKLETSIHQFAKRQMTWFRKMERDGSEIHWLDTRLSMEEKIKKAVMWLENKDKS
ncbi:tRNA (adenosine(37)-N6)-dimethylallyltransferase MiaA [Limibacter armeniacum]|uniref:tRNA (adenosine(37)-N6)-dimethylallyltransferase MiaA n=1 Tax=Limibacter armeniacum TaxID=466084 RepID=UPI002FE5D334